MEFNKPTDQGSFDDLVRNVTDGIAETGEKLTECNEAYDAKKGDISLWDKFLDWFKNTMNEVRERLNDAIEKYNEFVATIADYLSPGNPFAMYAKHDKWITVKQKITGSKTTIEGSYLRADSTWKGDPGDGYGDLAERQKAAMDTLAGYTDSMMHFLNEYAEKIFNAWIDFGERMITYMLDQVDAASEFISADPLKWLDIVPKIVNVCTNLAQLAVDMTAQLARSFTASKSTADSLKQGMANLYGFPNGTWPAAVIY
ncbi:hypothetical protein [Microbacterium paraoxydans]|uniref:hypothetical protein n=1 Tax=Microbacterium paraoxydans TaxID=199592 RepID=UPI003D73A5D4